MIKIIHFVPSINCTSGIIQLLLNYYRKMDRNTFQFEFLYFSEKTINNFEDEILRLGGTSTKISSPVKYLKFKKELNEYFKKHIENVNNTIFHNHQIAFTIFLKRIVNKNGISNFIVHNHMTKYSDKFLSAIRNYILCIPIKYMKLQYFACSIAASKLCFGKNDVYIMQNGIDLKKYKFNEESREKYRKKFNIKDNEYVIGNIGHFEPVKNHELTIKAFLECLEYNHNMKLVLIGTGSLKEKYLEMIRKHKIADKVIILENRNDIPQLLSMMDCFVFPSRFEGLGIAAIEAQASGLPIIISNKVPKEVQICNYKVLDISNNIDDWKCEIIKMKNNKVAKDRKHAIKSLEISIFNIDNSVKLLEKKYYNILKER